MCASIIARPGWIVNGAALVGGGAGQEETAFGFFDRRQGSGQRISARVPGHVLACLDIGGGSPGNVLVAPDSPPGGSDVGRRIGNRPRKLQAALEHSGGHRAHERALRNLLRRGVGGVRVINGPLQIGCEDGGKRLLAALTRDIQGPADQGACLDRLGNLPHLAAAQAGDAARDALNSGFQGPGGRAKGQGLPGVRPLRFGLAGRVARRLDAK